MIDRYFDRGYGEIVPQMAHPFLKVIDLKVYKLEAAAGRKEWVEIKDLGACSLFIGELCSFFVAEDECRFCKSNCIYYMDYMLPYNKENNEHVGNIIPSNNVGVLDLNARKLGNLASFPANARMFWPLPAWFGGSN